MAKINHIKHHSFYINLWLLTMHVRISLHNSDRVWEITHPIIYYNLNKINFPRKNDLINILLKHSRFA